MVTPSPEAHRLASSLGFSPEALGPRRWPGLTTYGSRGEAESLREASELFVRGTRSGCGLHAHAQGCMQASSGASGVTSWVQQEKSETSGGAIYHSTLLERGSKGRAAVPAVWRTKHNRTHISRKEWARKTSGSSITS